jgi:hypothetical protein
MVKRLDVVEVSYSESEGDLTEQTLKTCSFNLESTDLCYVSSYPEHADRCVACIRKIEIPIIMIIMVVSFGGFQ